MTITPLMPDNPLNSVVKNLQNPNIGNILNQNSVETPGSSFADTFSGIVKGMGSVSNQFNPEVPNINNINIDDSFEPNIGNPQGPKFVDTFSDFIKDVDSLQKQSGDLTEKFVKGEPVDIHEVMIAAEKSKTSFQLLMEIRNKFTDLYKEVLRMQV